MRKSAEGLVIAAVAFAMSVLAPSTTSGASEHMAPNARVAPIYDLYADFPNNRRRHGYFLRGINEFGSATSTSGPQTASLWFQSLTNGAFKEFNTLPYRECHWDILRWGAGTRGVLRYSMTEADCYSDHTQISFHPGIAYMPRIWALGEKWSYNGVSSTAYSENGTPVCTGTNAWHSRVLGLASLPGGATAVHTQTNEIQTLLPIAGAPSSAACPAGAVTTFGWQENFYLGGSLTVRRQDGSPIGNDVGMVRSTGGNAAELGEAGDGEWNSIFDSWVVLPPADAGSLMTAPTTVANASSGNTITFTYTAPSGGLFNGVVSVAVAPDWTAPVTVDAIGCTTATAGTVATNGQTITVSALTLPPNAQLDISYGAISGGSCTADDGATAPSTPGAPLWQAEVTLTQGGPVTVLASSPSIDVPPA